jgi:hypothetical protein
MQSNTGTVFVLANGDPRHRVIFADLQTFGAWYAHEYPASEGETANIDPKEGDDLTCFCAYKECADGSRVGLVECFETEYDPYTMTANVSRSADQCVDGDLYCVRIRRMERGVMVEIRYYYVAK